MNIQMNHSWIELETCKWIFKVGESNYETDSSPPGQLVRNFVGTEYIQMIAGVSFQATSFYEISKCIQTYK